jgi:phosphoglycerate dehydrogenase-like enzyme
MTGQAVDKTRIAVLDDWQRVARASADWAPLEARADVRFFTEPFASADDAAATLAGFDVILATRERTPFPKSLIDRLPRLKMFGLTGLRAGQIDLSHMQQRGVVVCFTDGGPGVASTAELALALMLAAARRIPESAASVRAGRFQLDAPTGFVLAGKTLGLVGLGRIGGCMARYGQALGMSVLAWSQNLTDERAAEAGAQRVGKDELLAGADVVSLHLVLAPRTRGVLGAADIARMKRGAILVNTSRAPLVDESALTAAARDGRIVAALDVYEREPLPAGHPLLTCPNTVLTPHLGYSVLEVYRVFYRQCVENALAYLDGAPIRLLPAQSS